MKKINLLFAVFSILLISCQKELIEINKTKNENKLILNSDVEKNSTQEKGFRFDVVLNEASSGIMTIVHGSETIKVKMENFTDTVSSEGIVYKYFSFRKEYSQASLIANNLILVNIKLDEQNGFIFSEIFRNGSLGLSPMNQAGTIFERSTAVCSDCSEVNNSIIIPKASNTTNKIDVADVYL